MLSSKATRGVILVCAILLMVSPATAATYTLNDLVNGSVASFTSDNGDFTFSDFDISAPQEAGRNLSNYTGDHTATASSSPPLRSRQPAAA